MKLRFPGPFMLLSGLLFVVLLNVFTGCSSPAQRLQSVKPGEKAPEFKLTDTRGKSHKLSDYRGRYVVLEWINFGCPFVKKHYNSGNMQKLQKEFTGKGVTWLSINSSSPGKQGDFPDSKLNRMLQEKNASPTAYLHDQKGTAGRAYGAKTTPHMFIVDPDGTLIYAGAIDDKATFDAEDVATANNYVKQALNEALAGKHISTANTKPYGCSVKY